MERSISTIKVNTIKNECRTKNDIKKRTKENTELIKELNVLRNERAKLRDNVSSLEQTIVELKFKQGKKERSETSTLHKGSKSLRPAHADETEAIPSLLHSRPKSGTKPGRQ